MQREATKHAQKTLKWFSAGAQPRTPLGELTTLPGPSSRLGRGYSLPIPHPPRRLRRLDPRRLRRLKFGPPTFQIKVTGTPLVFTCIFERYITLQVIRSTSGHLVQA